MMMPLRRALLLTLFFLVASCTTPAEERVPYTTQPPGTARLVFYRAFSYYSPTLVLTLALNKNVIGTLPTNAAIYRDVPPGTYTVTFSPTRPAPFQFKTVTAAAGNVFFIRIDALPQYCTGGRFGPDGCDITGFTSTVVDPATAQFQMQPLPLLRG